MENNLLLEIKNLKTYFFLDEGVLKAVDGVNFTIKKNTILGVIGESGCGKSVTAQSILRLIPYPGKIMEGNILLYHRDKIIDLVKLKAKGKKIRKIRGKDISMIFQDPMTSLSPVHTVGHHILEPLLLHRTKDKNKAKEIGLDMLYRVGIPDPAERFNSYAHQLSGGLRQRVMIAIALSCNPKLLIADEPTTALDVTIQAQILELLKELQKNYNMSILYITHDLGVIADIVDECVVMYLGKIVEKANVKELFHNPLHPYTKLLMKSIPMANKKSNTRLETIKGSVPVPINLPEQCVFQNRCPEKIKSLCDKKIPHLLKERENHTVRCFLYFNKKGESKNGRTN